MIHVLSENDARLASSRSPRSHEAATQALSISSCSASTSNLHSHLHSPRSPKMSSPYSLDEDLIPNDEDPPPSSKYPCTTRRFLAIFATVALIIGVAIAIGVVTGGGTNVTPVPTAPSPIPTPPVAPSPSVPVPPSQTPAAPSPAPSVAPSPSAPTTDCQVGWNPILE